MKQILVLEDNEVRQLQRGKTLLLSTGAGDIGLQFNITSSNGHHKNGKAKKGIPCEHCGATKTVLGKPFNERMLARHKAKAHSRKAKE